MGVLDYDSKMSNLSTKVTIKIVYPTKAFGEDNTDFNKRHESMQADADEHYKLLVDMQLTDPVFDRLLLDNHKRKQKVESLLNDSANWQRFVR